MYTNRKVEAMFMYCIFSQCSPVVCLLKGHRDTQTAKAYNVTFLFILIAAHVGFLQGRDPAERKKHSAIQPTTFKCIVSDTVYTYFFAAVSSY